MDTSRIDGVKAPQLLDGRDLYSGCNRSIGHDVQHFDAGTVPNHEVHDALDVFDARGRHVDLPREAQQHRLDVKRARDSILIFVVSD